ncbi:hypothetical protein ABKN59_007233 [Abortiporus biennis]
MLSTKTRLLEPAIPLSVLSESKAWLSILEKFLDGTPVPNGVAGAAVELIKVAENVTKFKEDCMSVAYLAYQITDGILEATKGVKAEDNPRLADDLNSFRKKLENITVQLKELSSRSVLARILRQDAMASAITKAKTELNNQIVVFNIRHGINMQVVMTSQYQLLKQQIENLESKISSPAMLSEQNPLFIATKLPPPPPYIFGRDQLIQEAIEMILSRAETTTPARVPIMGAGGIGKTTIARAIAYDHRICAHFKSHRYFVGCDTVLTAHALVQELTNILHDLTSTTSQESFQDLLQAISRMGPCLLILDNFETPWSISEQRVHLDTLLGHLNGLSNVSIVLTMRGKSRPTTVTWTSTSFASIPPLEVSAACDAFLAIADMKDTPETAVQDLVKTLDCVPLAITLMAKLAMVGGSVTELQRQWDRDPSSMMADEVEDRASNVEYSIQLSIQSPRLQQFPQALDLLKIISMLPNGVNRADLDSIAGDVKGLSRAIYILQEVSLIDQDHGDRLKVLSPIRAYVMSKLPPSQEASSQVYLFFWRLAEQYSEHVSETGDLSMIDPGTLHAELGNLNYLLTTALKEDEITKEIIQAAHDFTTLLYWTIPSNELLQILLDRDSWPCDLLLKAKCHQLYSDIATRAGNFAQASQSISIATDIFRTLDNLLGVAQCLQSLGDIAKLQGQQSAAKSLYLEALELFETADGKLGYAQTLQSLANMECANRNHSVAEDLYKDALYQFIALEDVIGSAQSLVGLGEVAQTKDEYELALEYFGKAREQFLQIGHMQGANHSLAGLAGAAAMQGRFKVAIPQFLEAQKQFQVIGDVMGEMQCSQALGDVARVQGRAVEAQVLLHKANIFFHHLGDMLASNQCLQALGDLAISEGDWKLAEDIIISAKSRFDEMQKKLESSQCVLSLGRLARKQGHFKVAQEFLSTALEQFQSIRERRGAAECMRQIGLIHLAQNNDKGAFNYLKQSLEQSKMLGVLVAVAECIEGISWVACKDPKRYEEATKLLQEAQAMYGEMDIEKKHERSVRVLIGLMLSVPVGMPTQLCAQTHGTLGENASNPFQQLSIDSTSAAQLEQDDIDFGADNCSSSFFYKPLRPVPGGEPGGQPISGGYLSTKHKYP